MINVRNSSVRHGVLPKRLGKSSVWTFPSIPATSGRIARRARRLRRRFGWQNGLLDGLLRRRGAGAASRSPVGGRTGDEGSVRIALIAPGWKHPGEPDYPLLQADESDSDGVEAWGRMLASPASNNLSRGDSRRQATTESIGTPRASNGYRSARTGGQWLHDLPVKLRPPLLEVPAVLPRLPHRSKLIVAVM